MNVANKRLPEEEDQPMKQEETIKKPTAQGSRKSGVPPPKG